MESRENRAWRTRFWATALTAFAVLIWAGVAYRFYPENRHMTPNEWGDYLAGLAGALALGFLVRGFFMQAEELEMQRATLSLTRKEVAEQTKVWKEELALLKEQHEAAQEQQRQSRCPRLSVLFDKAVVSPNHVQRMYKVFNNGATAFQVSCRRENAPPDVKLLDWQVQDIPTGGHAEFGIESLVGRSLPQRST